MKMRVHKFLSQAGVSSRREAERAIAEGKVEINGRQALIGESIDSELDVVRYKGRTINSAEPKIIYLVNKPRGYISSVRDPQGRKTVLSLVPKHAHLYPVGRLDYESEGLMLMTNDGDFAYRLTHPKFEVKKRYRVQVVGRATPDKIGRLTSGVNLAGKKAKADEVEIIELGDKRSWLDITIHEGRNRQIRKMCDAVKLPVTRLIRTHLGPYELSDLKPGDYQIVEKRSIDS